MAPRASPRTPHWSLNSRRQAPSRVPPDQSTHCRTGRPHGRVGVPGGQLTGQSGQPGADGEGLDPRPAGHRRPARSGAGPGHGPPSSRTRRRRSTKRRGRSPGSSQRRSIVSPPARMAARVVRRRSGQRPRLAGRAGDAETGDGPDGRRAAASRRIASVRSASVQAAKSLCRSTSPGDQRTTWVGRSSSAPSSCPSPPSSVAAGPRDGRGRQRWRSGPQLLVAAEEGGEGHVVDPDVLRAADERRPSRPVDEAAVVEADGLPGPHEGQHAVDGTAKSAERSTRPKATAARSGRQGRGRLRHRAGRPCGRGPRCPGPGPVAGLPGT